jgi:ComF family protein
MHRLVSWNAWYPWWRAVRGLVFPETCLVCGGAIETSPLCAECAKAMEPSHKPRCPRCALPSLPQPSLPERRRGCAGCFRHPPRFDAAVTLGTYEGPLRHICLQLKSPRSGWIAPRAVELLLDSRRDQIREWLAGSTRGPSSVVVVPVPLHWWRHWRRGFNQAEALAVAVANRLGLRFCRALRRVRSTPHLSRLSRTERKVRLRRAFRVRRRVRNCLVGRDVILIDDILTTGATCNAATRALKNAGARRVFAMVLARAKDY